MSYNLSEKTLLVGAGSMALEYSKVLQALEVPFTVLGRGKQSAKRFFEETRIPVLIGDLENNLSNIKSYNKAIVTVNVEQLLPLTLKLLKNGYKNILVEKPAGLNLEEIRLLVEESEKQQAEIYVAYNRRFYSSVIEARKIIEKDGGVSSFNFEFTEWSHVIEKLDKPKEVLQQWFLANSTHVIDLAFYLGGYPKQIECFTTGGTDWHPKASIYSGAGITETDALFSYQANWQAPGRWGVEILTKSHRLIFRPLEQLHIQKIGEVKIEKIEINDDQDHKYKPGLFKQTEEFLLGNKVDLLDISSHYKICKEIFSKINNGV